MNGEQVRTFLTWLKEQHDSDNIANVHVLGLGTRLMLRYPRVLHYTTGQVEFAQNASPDSANFSFLLNKVGNSQYAPSTSHAPGFLQLDMLDGATVYINLKR